MTRVLAFPKYGPAAASTRQRLLQFLPALRSAGFSVEVSALLDDDYVRALAEDATYSRRKLAAAYARRFRTLGRSPGHDLLWIYAELFPGLPAPFEQLARLSGRPFIYDCDDAFFHAHEESALLRGKLRGLVKAAAIVTAGNAYLADHLRRWNDRVHIVPTVVDTNAYRPGPRTEGTPVIGWIGSPSTWPFVRPYLPLLAELCSGGKARFLAVGAGAAAAAELFPGMELRAWAEQREVADVQAMDIGIMPLPDEPWARGKCGYKLIQYLACGMPVVASPVGVNRAIVTDGESGFLASTEADWLNALRQLLGDVPLRGRLGAAGREHIVRDYSLARFAPLVVSLFEQASRRSPDRRDRPNG